MEPQPPGSPRCGRGDSISKFSLLGQQFTRYGSAPAQHQGQSSQAAPSVGFSLVPPLTQTHAASHGQMGNPSHGGSNGGNSGPENPGATVCGAIYSPRRWSFRQVIYCNGSSADLQQVRLVGTGPGLGLNSFQQNGAGNSSMSTTPGPTSANNCFSLQSGFGAPDTSNCQNGNGTTNHSGDSLFTAQGSGGGEGSLDDNDTALAARDEDDDGESENLPPGSYKLVEMDRNEILAEHTHFCEICGKGFKRDANLRMHMRGHGDEYKTPAALARPEKAQDSAPVQPRRYSCPHDGCKRNKKHARFQPLKTMLCVKNHYRRSHCAKMYTCNRCKSKKFSVVADLKTHEKHCGRDKWQCSCGTTFSRKDKLFGHIALFQGHTPAFPPNELEGSRSTDQMGGNGVKHNISNSGTAFANSCGSVSGMLAGPDVVSCSYRNGDTTCIDPGTNRTLIETGNRSVHAQTGLKNIGFSEEGSAQNIAVDTSNPIAGFPSPASGLIAGPFMFPGLLSNNFLQQTGGN
ncbi:hypothetical protein SUGI_0408750 [Cryptomeria japonica]|nr:hypothetical protein SUGI_0408750 [Cryptomeria japonica]